MHQWKASIGCFLLICILFDLTRKAKVVVPEPSPSPRGKSMKNHNPSNDTGMKKVFRDWSLWERRRLLSLVLCVDGGHNSFVHHPRCQSDWTITATEQQQGQNAPRSDRNLIRPHALLGRLNLGRSLWYGLA